jgi:hypothetical protein
MFVEFQRRRAARIQQSTVPLRLPGGYTLFIAPNFCMCGGMYKTTGNRQWFFVSRSGAIGDPRYPPAQPRGDAGAPLLRREVAQAADRAGGVRGLRGGRGCGLGHAGGKHKLAIRSTPAGDRAGSRNSETQEFEFGNQESRQTKSKIRTWWGETPSSPAAMVPGTWFVGGGYRMPALGDADGHVRGLCFWRAPTQPENRSWLWRWASRQPNFGFPVQRVPGGGGAGFFL